MFPRNPGISKDISPNGRCELRETTARQAAAIRYYWCHTMSSFLFFSEWFCCSSDGNGRAEANDDSRRNRHSLVVERRRSVALRNENDTSKDVGDLEDAARLRRFRSESREAIELAFFRQSFSSFCIIERRIVRALSGLDGLPHFVRLKIWAYCTSEAVALRRATIARCALKEQRELCTLTETWDFGTRSWHYAMYTDPKKISPLKTPEITDSPGSFVLAARERRMLGRTIFDISIARGDASFRFRENIVARLQSNAVRTRWCLTHVSGRKSRELARIHFEANVLRNAPTKHVVRMFRPSEEGGLPYSFRDDVCLRGALDLEAEDECGGGSSDKDKKSDDGAQSDVLTLVTNQAQWNEDLNCYQLNFQGRVKYSSARNFQLRPSGSSAVIFQFGRKTEKGTHKNTYALDYEFPLSPVVAMSIGLCQCSEKVVC